MPCPCCNPQPCRVVIDGVPVEVPVTASQVNLDVEWTHAGRTLQVPTGQQTFDYWYGLSTNPDATWGEQYVLGEESRQFQSWQLLTGSTGGWHGSASSAFSTLSRILWTRTQVDSTTCRIQGDVETQYNLGTMDTGVRPYQSTDYEIRALWRWTCNIVSGVQQAVTYELIGSYRYEWDSTSLSFLPVTGGSAGSAPVVTVTIAP